VVFISAVFMVSNLMKITEYSYFCVKSKVVPKHDAQRTGLGVVGIFEIGQPTTEAQYFFKSRRYELKPIAPTFCPNNAKPLVQAQIS
jgi:hypothetical protein